MTRVENVLSRIETYRNWIGLIFPLNRCMPKERIVVTRDPEVRLRVRSIFGEDLTVIHEQFYRDDYGVRRVNLPQRAAVVDVGANIGAFSLFLAGKVERLGGVIHAYEPSRVNMDELRKNVELNGKGKIVLTHSLALDADAKTKLLYLSRKHYAHSLIDGEDASGESVPVQCTTIDSIFSDNGIARIDLLKLDIEGSEYEVLYKISDMLFERISRIVLEIHEREGRSKADLVDFLRRKGYVVRQSSGNENVYCATAAGVDF